MAQALRVALAGLGTVGGGETGWGIAVNIAFIALLANGLRTGRRLAWWGTGALAAINVLAGGGRRGRYRVR